MKSTTQKSLRIYICVYGIEPRVLEAGRWLYHRPLYCSTPMIFGGLIVTKFLMRSWGHLACQTPSPSDYGTTEKVHGTWYTLYYPSEYTRAPDIQHTRHCRTPDYELRRKWHMVHPSSAKQTPRKLNKTKRCPPLTQTLRAPRPLSSTTPRRNGYVFPVTKDSGRRGGETPESRATDSCSYARGIQI